jgi:hypothetical protein
MPISAGIVFEVRKTHRDLDPPVGGMMVFRPGARVKNLNQCHLLPFVRLFAGEIRMGSF